MASMCKSSARTDLGALAATNATLISCGVTPRDQSAKIIGIPASFGSLAIIMVVLRVIDRLLLRKVSLDWDDYLVVMAVVWQIINGIRPSADALHRCWRVPLTLFAIQVSTIARVGNDIADHIEVAQHGMGKEFWSLSPNGINSTLLVSPCQSCT